MNSHTILFRSLIETMNKAIGCSIDPQAELEVDQVTTAVINSGCFSCCLVILSMISIATEPISHIRRSISPH